MPEILCLGEPLFELNEGPDGQFLPGHGGDTSNCAIAAARQGASVGYITHIGDDNFGRSFLKLWQREQVDTSNVKIVPDGETGVYFVTHGPTGHQFSYRRAGSPAARMTPEHVPGEAIADARLIHISAISQAISTEATDTVFAALAAARSADTLISFDTNLRLKLWPLERARALINHTSSMCDILLPGLDDAVALTGLEAPQAIVDFYLDNGARIVALTMGANGVLLGTQDQRRTIAPHQVNAVDATGAGDTFDGAFLAEYLRSGDAFTAASYGNAAAALSTTGYGAVAPMPGRPAVEALLAASAVR